MVSHRVGFRVPHRSLPELKDCRHLLVYMFSSGKSVFEAETNKGTGRVLSIAL